MIACHPQLHVRIKGYDYTNTSPSGCSAIILAAYLRGSGKIPHVLVEFQQLTVDQKPHHLAGFFFF